MGMPHCLPYADEMMCLSRFMRWGSSTRISPQVSDEEVIKLLAIFVMFVDGYNGGVWHWRITFQALSFCSYGIDALAGLVDGRRR